MKTGSPRGQMPQGAPGVDVTYLRSLRAQLGAPVRRAHEIVTQSPRGGIRKSKKPLKDTSLRLQELEAASSRHSELLHSLTATTERLAQLANRSSSKQFKEEREIPPTTSGNSPNYDDFEVLLDFQQRLVTLEMRVAELNAQAAILQIRQAQASEARGSETARVPELSDSAQQSGQSFMYDKVALQGGGVDLDHVVMQDSTEIARLEEEKRQAVQAENYDLANKLKLEIDALKAGPGFPGQESSLAKVEETKGLSKSVAPVAEQLEPCPPEAAREIEASVWEAAILLGLPGIPLPATAMIFIGMVVNVFFQGLFCLIIGSQFLVGQLPEEEFLQFWRVQAHDLSQMDPLSGATLVARLCFGDQSMQVAQSQTEVLDFEEVYLSPLPVFGVATGPTLFSISWLLWYIVAFNEASKSVSFFSALYQLPRRGRPRLEVTEEGCRLESIDTSHVLLMLVVTTLRLGICVILAVFGSLWLSHILNVEDLVLNAAALGFVMELDELVFEAAMPAIVQLLVSNLEPLPFHKHENPIVSSCLDVIGVRPMLAFAFGCVACFTLVQYNIMHNVDALTEMEEILCGGNKDFITWYDSKTGFILARKSMPFTVESNKLIRYSSTAQTFTELRDFDIDSPLTDELGNDRTEHLTAFFTPTIEAFDLFQYSTIQDHAYSIGYGMADCKSSKMDVFPERMPKYIVNALATITNQKTVAGCGNITMKDCDSKTAPLVRVICPEQCGCDLPFGGLFYGGAQMGCPRQKCEKSIRWVAQIEAAPCRDQNQEQLAKRPGWKRYWASFAKEEDADNGGSFFYEPRSLDSQGMAKFAEEKGCDAMMEATQLWYAFCQQTPSINSITTFCPQACGCTVTPDLPGCPKQCMDITKAYVTALENLPCKDMEAGSLGVGLPHQQYRTAWTLRYYKNPQNKFGLLEANVSSMFVVHDFVNKSGCKGKVNGYPLHWFCGSELLSLDVQAICPELCQCRITGAFGCPTQCGTGTYPVVEDR